MNTALLGHRRLDPISRRSFVRTSAGALAAGAAVGTGLWRPALALTKQPADPVPIPGGSPQIPGFHVFGPGFPGLDPADAEPATITDFNGFIGLGYISGTVSRRNTHTGEVDELPFLGSDMRFMHGVYRGTDGQIRRGTFGFV